MTPQDYLDLRDKSFTVQKITLHQYTDGDVIFLYAETGDMPLVVRIIWNKESLVGQVNILLGDEEYIRGGLTESEYVAAYESTLKVAQEQREAIQVGKEMVVAKQHRGMINAEQTQSMREADDFLDAMGDVF